MTTRSRLWLLSLLMFLTGPAHAHAGMPSITLTDLARMRVQSISFFLLGYLVSSGCVKLIWNYLRRDFTRLPKLSYGKALGLVGLWGLLFVLVLTMISGARELMTPGAWEKVGLTYKLAEKHDAPSEEEQLREREKKLEKLRAALWEYARRHNWKFPPESAASGIPDEIWQTSDASAMRYVYVIGLTAGDSRTPLAYEPGIFDSKRLVLFTDAQIEILDTERLEQLLKQTRAQ